ncbi:LOW QUALITY PROTEIN: uncharacterized protein [Symphalangus syndactylus]|uniref:LOW QUALITY PROTEIN: uncharacterized protein n=1 Tax=Symphalangus syndactylus TaxID=9590 RepID=UPI0030065EA6
MTRCPGWKSLVFQTRSGSCEQVSLDSTGLRKGLVLLERQAPSHGEATQQRKSRMEASERSRSRPPHPQEVSCDTRPHEMRAPEQVDLLLDSQHMSLNPLNCALLPAPGHCRKLRGREGADPNPFSQVPSICWMVPSCCILNHLALWILGLLLRAAVPDTCQQPGVAGWRLMTMCLGDVSHYKKHVAASGIQGSHHRKHVTASDIWGSHHRKHVTASGIWGSHHRKHVAASGIRGSHHRKHVAASGIRASHHRKHVAASGIRVPITGSTWPHLAASGICGSQDGKKHVAASGIPGSHHRKNVPVSGIWDSHHRKHVAASDIQGSYCMKHVPASSLPGSHHRKHVAASGCIWYMGFPSWEARACIWYTGFIYFPALILYLNPSSISYEFLFSSICTLLSTS